MNFDEVNALSQYGMLLRIITGDKAVNCVCVRSKYLQRDGSRVPHAPHQMIDNVRHQIAETLHVNALVKRI